jgi:hypothetical protein
MEAGGVYRKSEWRRKPQRPPSSRPSYPREGERRPRLGATAAASCRAVLSANSEAAAPMPGTSQLPQNADGCSLSPRERVRVRGRGFIDLVLSGSVGGARVGRAVADELGFEHILRGPVTGSPGFRQRLERMVRFALRGAGNCDSIARIASLSRLAQRLLLRRTDNAKPMEERLISTLRVVQQFVQGNVLKVLKSSLARTLNMLKIAVPTGTGFKALIRETFPELRSEVTD